MNDNYNGFSMQDRMKEKTSEVIARKRRLSCFCGWQDRFLGIDAYENGPASCTTVEDLKMQAETANECGQMAVGIRQKVWKRC
jgi:hypothetical protein